MKAREKAEELVNKFSPLVTTWDCYNDTPANPDDIKKDAKQCALICVEEILFNDGFTEFDQYLTEYWQQVKTEIENL